MCIHALQVVISISTDDFWISYIATFLYEMNIPLPCSTLALAIGAFECRQTSTVALSCTIPCRVFSATSLINVACEELLPRCAKYVTAACGLLGPYPFTRMDLVILPRCFACMGLMRYALLKISPGKHDNKEYLHVLNSFRLIFMFHIWELRTYLVGI